jgi:hypothetical protein
VLLALCVIALAVVFGRGAVGFGSALVMFGCFVVFVSSHWFSGNVGGSQRKLSEVGFGSCQPKKKAKQCQPRSYNRAPTEQSRRRPRSSTYKTRRLFESFVLEATPIFGRSSLNGDLAFDVATLIGFGFELFGQFAKIARRCEI